VKYILMLFLVVASSSALAQTKFCAGPLINRMEYNSVKFLVVNNDHVTLQLRTLEPQYYSEPSPIELTKVTNSPEDVAIYRGREPVSPTYNGRNGVEVVIFPNSSDKITVVLTREVGGPATRTFQASQSLCAQPDEVR
jgi:hypothetical protein